MRAKLKTYSYRPKETKRGFLRVNGKFAKEVWRSKNHRMFSMEISEGDEIDARGNYFGGADGRSRWDAPWPQWVKIQFADGKLRCFNFKGEERPRPNWIELELIEEEVEV